MGSWRAVPHQFTVQPSHSVSASHSVRADSSPNVITQEPVT